MPSLHVKTLTGEIFEIEFGRSINAISIRHRLHALNNDFMPSHISLIRDGRDYPMMDTDYIMDENAVLFMVSHERPLVRYMNPVGRVIELEADENVINPLTMIASHMNNEMDFLAHQEYMLEDLLSHRWVRDPNKLYEVNDNRSLEFGI